jgi:FkbM family methyltransferase
MRSNAVRLMPKWARPSVIIIRSWARKTRLTQVLSGMLHGPYEGNFRAAMLANIRIGDTVWDIGANTGLYTRLFAERAGSNGCVVAFEPAPACYSALLDQFAELPQVILENLAVGREDCEAVLRLAQEPLAATHRIESAASSKEDGLVVRMVSCDSYSQYGGRTPNLIKIDVEGLEREVIRGMSRLLKARELRAVFIEVHFALLEERGESMAPIEIEETLENNGFATKWVDSSHLQAIR